MTHHEKKKETKFGLEPNKGDQDIPKEFACFAACGTSFALRPHSIAH